MKFLYFLTLFIVSVFSITTTNITITNQVTNDSKLYVAQLDAYQVSKSPQKMSDALGYAEFWLTNTTNATIIRNDTRINGTIVNTTTSIISTSSLSLSCNATFYNLLSTFVNASVRNSDKEFLWTNLYVQSLTSLTADNGTSYIKAPNFLYGMAIPINAQQLNKLDNDQYFIEIVSLLFPSGEIRGRISKAIYTFSSGIDSLSASGYMATPQKANAFFTLNPSTKIVTYQITFFPTYDYTMNTSLATFQLYGPNTAAYSDVSATTIVLNTDTESTFLSDASTSVSMRDFINGLYSVLLISSYDYLQNLRGQIYMSNINAVPVGNWKPLTSGCKNEKYIGMGSSYSTCLQIFSNFSFILNVGIYESLFCAAPLVGGMKIKGGILDYGRNSLFPGFDRLLFSYLHMIGTGNTDFVTQMNSNCPCFTIERKDWAVNTISDCDARYCSQFNNTYLNGKLTNNGNNFVLTTPVHSQIPQDGFYTPGGDTTSIEWVKSTTCTDFINAYLAQPPPQSSTGFVMCGTIDAITLTFVLLTTFYHLLM